MEENARKRKASGQLLPRKEKVSALLKIDNQKHQDLLLTDSDSEEDRNRTPSGNILPNTGDIRGFFEKKTQGGDLAVLSSEKDLSSSSLRSDLKKPSVNRDEVKGKKKSSKHIKLTPGQGQLMLHTSVNRGKK